ncbi:MAG: protein translocase subunit SecD [Pseudomonadota bacterium]|nr:protein translocase subunit SecD [Pseudomonadota bacterium]
MKPFGIWKYFLILLVLSLGILYALPNLYPTNPAVQVSYADSSFNPDKDLATRLNNILEENLKDKSLKVELFEKYALIRLSSTEEQLEVKSLLSSVGSDLIVALNLAPTTPQWLKNIGAKPMKLGLDLRGGVHFLMEVDTKTALTNRLNGTLQDLKIKLRQEEIRYVSVFVDKDQSIKLKTRNQNELDSAVNLIEENYPQFSLSSVDRDFLISMQLNEEEIENIEADAIDQNLTTLRNRVNELGVSEPIVQRQGKKRIVVQLPGIQDTAEAKKILGKTATLEFHLEAEFDTPRTRKTTYQHRNRRMGESELQDQIIIAGDQVATAQASFDENGLPQVNITLDGQGGSRMHRATRGNIGKRLGVLFVEQKTKTSYRLDSEGKKIPVYESIETKEIISLATIRAALGVQFRITGLDSPQESSELALLLRAGALAAPMRFVEERTVGPSLGEENINAGILSMELGMALVLLFTFYYYRLFGLAANLALGTNIVLIVAFMSILSASLTLPGIAGIVLTVGMAIDANVLIFSRIKEELKQGTSPLQAIDAGYEKAFSTILDANITTLIVAVILYSLGTGPIKGFSITLSIGILTSMFTAILGTRAFIYLIFKNKKNLKSLPI